MFDDGGGVGGEEELGGHGDTLLGQEGAGLGAVEEGLVRGREEVVRLLERNVLGGLLGGEGGSLVCELDVDKVDLHLLLGPHTDDKGRTLAGGDDLMGVVDRLDEHTEGALKLADDGLGEDGEFNGGVLVVDVLCELGDGLGVGLGLELEALGLEERLDLLVVGDDAIVDDGELPVGVRPIGGITRQPRTDSCLALDSSDTREPPSSTACFRRRTVAAGKLTEGPMVGRALGRCEEGRHTCGDGS